MVEPQSSITPDFLQRRFGPLSFLGWVGVLAGGGLVYYLYSRYAASAATTAATTTSSPISSTGATSGSGTTSLAGTFADTQSWLAAAVSAMTANGLDGADAYNTGQSFINGTCVSSAGYQALSSIMTSIGAPPGVSSTLSVCADTPTTPGSGGVGQQPLAVGVLAPVAAPPGSTTPGAGVSVSAPGSAIPGGIYTKLTTSELGAFTHAANPTPVGLTYWAVKDSSGNIFYMLANGTVRPAGATV